MTTDLIFGIRPVMEAIKSGRQIDKILIQEGIKSPVFTELKQLIKEQGVMFQYVPSGKLNHLTFNKNHQGVVCFISPVVFQTTDTLLPLLFEEGKIPLLIILDRVTDVRNFGAVARTAECAGANGIIIPSRGAAQINADAVKTSAGALYKIPVCREHNLKDTLKYMKDSGIQIIACTEKAEKYYFDADFTLPTAVLLGSEENGISGEYIKFTDDKVKIPLAGSIESLNVSVASGVVLYEAVRQRIKNGIVKKIRL